MKYILKFNESWLGDKVRDISNTDEKFGLRVYNSIPDDLHFKYMASEPYMGIKQFTFELPDICFNKILFSSKKEYNKTTFTMYVMDGYNTEMKISQKTLGGIYNKLQAIRYKKDGNTEINTPMLKEY